MIKPLKVSDKTVRKFKSSKTWDYSTVSSLTNLVLEQTKGGGEVIPIGLGIDKSLSTEQNTNTTDVKINRGKRLDTTFYPKGHGKHDPISELQNPDGSYYRSVYSSVHHLFYNEYGIYENEENIKNPLMVFGSETGNYQTDKSETNVLGERNEQYERRVIHDDILVIEFSKDQFGEKIKPNKFRIVDYSSPHGVIEIVDDGATNLLVSDLSFNEIKEITHSKSDKIDNPSLTPRFDASHLNYGKNTASDGEYVISGTPMSQDSPSDFLTGTASLFKYDLELNEFRKIREFKCPFTQEGLLIESEQNTSGFLVSELGTLFASDNYSLNDEFGHSVELKNGTCAISSPRSHIASVCNQSRQGHVFLYDVDKGGIEHWGLTNIIEGDPGSEFGSSVSLHGKYMAVGAPGMYGCEGAIYIFEKRIRTEETPWHRISDAHASYCYNEVHDVFDGSPVCDKLEELNKNIHRWKIETASPTETAITYFSDEPDDCSENEISMFSEETVCSVGYETKFPVSKYHTFESGAKSPKYGVGDYTWELVTIIKETGTHKLGQNIKLYEDILISSTPDEKEQNVYIFKKRNTGVCDKWIHTQTLNSDKVYNYDTNVLTLSNPFNSIKFNVVGTSIELDVENKPIPDTTSSGFVYSLDQRFGAGEDDTFENVVVHGGNVSTEKTIVIDEIEPGDHMLFIGRYHNLKLVGVPSVIRFSINPHVIDVSPRQSMVKYPFKYQPPEKSRYGVSLDTNGKFLLVGDDHDRVYSDTGTHSQRDKKYSAGAVYMYEIKSDTISFVEKIYENATDENRYSDRFGCDISLIGNDFLVGSPCIEQSKITIVDGGSRFIIPDFEFGVENNADEHYSVPHTLITDFDHEFLGDTYGDLKIQIDVSAFTDIAIEYISDFELRSSFISNENNSSVDSIHGAYTRGIYRDKTTYDGTYITFYANIDAHEFNPDEELEFIYYVKKNSIQGTATYFRINDDTHVESIKTIKSTKQKRNVKTQYGVSVSLSSDYIYVGNSVMGDWPVDQVSGFDGEDFVSFDQCSHIFTTKGDIVWGNLEKQNVFLEGMILAYDVKTIRDAERTYVGNIFYKNGIAVITELGEYFRDLLSKGGNRGYEITFDGVNSIYENEILCKVNPHEFNISTNPTSVNYNKIPFDITDDNKFDIIDLSYIYRYIMGTFKRTDVSDNRGSEVANSLVLEQDKKWPNEDVLMSESEDVILMSALENITADIDISRERELRLLERLDNLYALGSDGLDIDGDGVVSASDAKLLARYFVGRTGNSLIGGLINPLHKSVTRNRAYQIIEYLDEKTGKNYGREIMEDFLKYEELDKEDRTGSYLAPYATTIGLYDGTDLVMTAKLGRPVKLIPNYPINFLIKYDT